MATRGMRRVTQSGLSILGIVGVFVMLWGELKAALLTLREALVGFLIGGAIGFGLGVLFVRSTTAERAFMPYVVASQTAPIIAIAPMVGVWGGRLAVPQWLTGWLIA